MPPVGRVEAMFAQLKEQGYEYVIAVPLSAGISSTASMIEAAAKRAELGITVIDPYTTVNTQGYLAECAYKLAAAGAGSGRNRATSGGKRRKRKHPSWYRMI